MHERSPCSQVPGGRSLRLTGSRRRTGETSASPSTTRSGPSSGSWWASHWMCVFSGSTSSPLLRATNVLTVKDAPLTGISQARFHEWLVRDGRWREVGWLQRAREREGGGVERDWPCWTETNVRDWWRSEQHTDWCASWAARQAHSSLSFLFVLSPFGKGNSNTESFKLFTEKFS